MKTTTKPQLDSFFEVIEVYDNGCSGANEVARVRLQDGREVVVKVMLASKKYHQRRKALTEATMYLLDKGLGNDGRVVPDLYVELFSLTPSYIQAWGKENIEGHSRICTVVREYAPAGPGDEWRGEIYRFTGNLDLADEACKKIIDNHPDAERISILDFLTINQDRSARNWVTDHGKRFFAIDNGMAWFHEYPENDLWQQGCVVDDVILQVQPWQFISGVFTTSWAGRPLSEAMQSALNNFDEKTFLNEVEYAAKDLGFPYGLSRDWRFEGLLRRLWWMAENKRQPTADEYRQWRKGSELMTPPEIVTSGGRIIWHLGMDRNIEKLRQNRQLPKFTTG